MTKYAVLLGISALIAYLMGSLKSTVIASNFIFHRNLAGLGKGSVWLSNFKRLYGVKGFIKLGIVELVKDLPPVLIGGWLLGIMGQAQIGRAFAGFCLTLGSLYPVFYGFRGGNGAVCMIIAAACVNFSVAAAIAVVMAAAVWLSRYISLGVIGGAAAYIGAAVLVLDGGLLITLNVFTALLVLFKHIPAMFRLAAGREEKFVFVEDLSYKFDEKF